jgi:hypothetical protein
MARLKETRRANAAASERREAAIVRFGKLESGSDAKGWEDRSLEKNNSV